MSSTFDAVGPSTGTAQTGGGVTSITWSHTVTGSNKLMLAGVVLDDGGPDSAYTLSVTCGGAAMTSIGKVHSNNQTAGFLEVFKKIAPATGSNTILMSVTGGTPLTLSGGSLSFAGADQSSGAGTAATAFGSSTTPTVNVTSNTSGNVIAAFAGNANTNATATGTVTRRYTGGANNQGCGFVCGGTAPATGSSVTTGWSIPADWWAVVSVEVLASGAGAAADRGLAWQYEPPPDLDDEVTDDGGVPEWPPWYQDDGSPRIPAVTVNAGVAVAAATAPAPAFGTYITGLGGTVGGGYFTDPRGQPRLFVSAEDWGLLANGGAWNSGNYQSTYDTYFSQRAAQGYTAVEVTMFSYPGANVVFPFTDGRDWDGAWPFTSTNNPSSGLNSTFWARRDYLLASAAAQGITVVFNAGTPALAIGGDMPAGWTTTQWADYGTALGNRYKTTPNILWIVGDDYFGTVDTGLTAWLTALRGAGDTHPVSYQAYQEATSRKDISTGSTITWGAANAQYNWVYTYNFTYDGVEKAVQEASPIPTVWADGFFLASGTTGITDVNLLRRMAWWALSSGSRGFQTGDNDVWPWDTGAAAQITAKTWYTAQVPAIAAAFRGLPGWQTLMPDTSSVLVTAGRGTHGSPITSGGGGTPYTTNSDAYVTASRGPDSGSGASLAVIYMSHGSTITIDQTKMVSGYTATWVDPASGATSSATPGTTYNSTAKGTNSTGDADWALILQAPLGVSANAGVAAAAASATLTGNAGAANAAAATGLAAATLTGNADTAAAGAATALAVATLTGHASTTGTTAATALAAATLTGNASTTAAAPAAGLAAAPQPVAAVTVTTTAATALAAAPGASVSTSSAATAAAGAATALAVANPAVPAIGANPAPATALAVAPAPATAATVTAAPATALAVANPPVPAIAAAPAPATGLAAAGTPATAVTVTAGAATALAIGNAATVTTSTAGTANAAPAAALAAANPATPAAGVNGAPAAALAAAPAAATAVTVTAGAATALAAAAAPGVAATAKPAAATALAAAVQPVPAVTDAAGAATALAVGNAASVTVSSAGTANAQAAAASAAAVQPAAAITVPAGPAAALASAPASTGQASRLAAAGVAAALASAPAATLALAAAARAQAALALAAAPAALGAAVQPFTVGTLTASTSPGGSAGGALTAASAPAAAMTAGTQRTGGPGG